MWFVGKFCCLTSFVFPQQQYETGPKDGREREQVPKLSSEQLREIFRFRRKKTEAENTVEHWQTCATDLSKILQDVKKSIEQIYQDQQEIKQNLLSPTVRDEEKAELNDLLFQKQQKLMECLDLEDECFSQLSRVRMCARRAGLELDRAFCDTPRELERLNSVYEAKKLRNASDRIEREMKFKQQAESVKFSIMKTFLETALDKVLDEHDTRIKEVEMRKRRSESEWTARVFYRKTLASRQSVKEETKRATKAAVERRQVALQKLQDQILKSREELKVETQEILRTNKIKLERFKQNLGLADDENPYLVQKITSLYRKLKKAERQAHECKSQAEMLVFNEIKQREVFNNRQALQKRKTELFWKKLASQKRHRFQQQEVITAKSLELDRGDGWLVDSEEAVDDGILNVVKDTRQMKEARTSVPMSPFRDAEAESNSGTATVIDIPLLQPTIPMTIGSRTSVFHMTPSSLLFMDFEVGKTYTSTVTVTHQSRNRLKYYFKGMMDDSSLRDRVAPLSGLLTVDFTTPPLLSPGIVHRFRVKFKPTSNADASGSIVFTCDLGDFDLPVKIWKKTFKPEIIGGNQIKIPRTIMNQSRTEIIKIKNKGALPGWLTEILTEGYATDSTDSELRVAASETRDILAEAPEESVQLFDTEPESNEVAKSLANPKAKKLTKKTAAKNIVKKTKIQQSSEVPAPNAKRKAKSKPVATAKTKSKTLLHQSVEAKEAVAKILEVLLKQVIEDPFVIYAQDQRRLIPPNGSISLAVLFRPEFAGPHEMKSTLRLHSEDLEAFEIPIHLLSQGDEVPIQVSPQNVNLKICALNKVYQTMVTVSVDTSDKGMAVKSSFPKELREFVSVEPSEFKRVPATKRCNFAVRFQPTSTLFEGSSKQFFDQTTSIADWPIDFIATSKSTSCSVRATFMAVVTNTELLINPTEITFGRCLSNETAATKVRIHNPSLMMQKIGIRDISKELTLQPNFGFVTILPQASVELNLLLSPSEPPELSEKPQKYSLKIVSSGFFEYNIAVKAIVARHIAKLNRNKIFLPPLAVGSSAEIFVTLENLLFLIGDKAKLFFSAGSRTSSDVRVTPVEGHISYKEATKLRIVYRPQITEAQLQDHHLLLQRRSREELLKATRQELSLLRLRLYFDEQDYEDFVEPADAKDLPSANITPRKKPKKLTNKKKTLVTKEGVSPRSPSNKRQLQESKGRSDIVARKTQLEELLTGNQYVQPNTVVLPTDPLELANLKNDLLRNLLPSVRSTMINIDVSKQDSDGNINIKETISAEIIVAVVKPQLILVDEDSIVNFGQLQLGSRLTKTVAVQNVSDKTLHLERDLLNPEGPFIHVNALRPLEPDQVYEFRITFAPVIEGQYTDEFVIKTGNNNILILLKGTGSVAPVPSAKEAKLNKVLKNPKKKKVKIAEPAKTKKVVKK